jgi:hypothetical protein
MLNGGVCKTKTIGSGNRAWLVVFSATFQTPRGQRARSATQGGGPSETRPAMRGNRARCHAENFFPAQNSNQQIGRNAGASWGQIWGQHRRVSPATPRNVNVTPPLPG